MYLLFLKRTICIFFFLAALVTLCPAQELGLTKVVIDAGHGGKDPGCVSRDKKTYEKTLTLDIAKKLAYKISSAYPQVQVVLTRGDDRSVSLDSRAQVANNIDANLFISIHINSSTQTAPNGYSVHVMGESSNKDRDLYAYNLNVCQRENAVIRLEDDYNTKFEGFDPSDPESFIFMTLMQNAYLEQSMLFAQMVSDELKGGPVKNGKGIWQDPFYVLWKTAMPSVLVELGFISNSSDLAVLRDPGKRDELAARLFEAFKAYKTQYDRSILIEKPQTSDAAPVQQTLPAPESVSVSQPDNADVVVYGVQIFAVSRDIPGNDPAFLGYEVRKVRTGSVYKYVIGLSKEVSSARSNLLSIRKKYPDAFLVSIRENSVERVK